MNMKIHPSPRRHTMPISKLGQRRQVVIPKEICDELGLQEGDFVEVTSTKGKVIITPKKVVDADEVLTAAQRALIDKRLAEAEEDIKAGRVSGPFATADHLKRHLDAKR
jgi:AbrB family looped-hinge helix DNA binding protein